MSIAKGEQIKHTLEETRRRRKTQKPVVYVLKLQNLSSRREDALQRAFLEAKWLYNWLLSDTTRLEIPANKVSVVQVKVGNNYEERELIVLGSQIKQEIADRLEDNLRALSVLKKNGHEVGRLKYKKFINSIPLKQYGVTYSLDFSHNRVRIQKLGKFRVLGLNQIPPEVEIVSPVLVRKPSGYYIHVTCYISDDDSGSDKIEKDVGVDFGVASKLTLTNGIKIDYEIHETERLKRLQRKLARTKEKSRNRKRIRVLLRREYEKLNNRRKDAQNRVLAFLKVYRKVAFQDDCVRGWSALFGRQVHSSGIGELKSRLRDSLETPVIVPRGEPTTGECFACGKRNSMCLSDREFICDCGWKCDRDVNAALVILRKGLGLSPDQAVGLDWPELKPLEREAAARIMGSNPYIRVSFLQ